MVSMVSTFAPPMPPCSSGTCSPSRPSSASLAQISRLQPSFESSVASRAANEYSLPTKRCTASFKSCCSLVRSKSISEPPVAAAALCFHKPRMVWAMMFF